MVHYTIIEFKNNDKIEFKNYCKSQCILKKNSTLCIKNCEYLLTNFFKTIQHISQETR